MAKGMNKKESELFKFIMARYKKQHDENDYYRRDHDEALEYYQSYKNPYDEPLAYNDSFNRILPIIYTYLQRFMSQLYQGGNIVSVKPRKHRDLNNAKAVEAVLNFQLENLNSIDMQGGSYLTLYKWFFNAITFGKGLLKAYWRKEERISPRRTMLPVPTFDRFGNFGGMEPLDHITMEPQIVYDGPYVEVLHNKLFVPDVKYKNIQQMPLVFIVYRRSMDEIKQRVDRGIYDKRFLKSLGWTDGGGAGKEVTDSDEAFVHSLNIKHADLVRADALKDDLRSPMIDVIECYGRMILEDNPYEVGSGIKIKGQEEEAIVHIGNYKTLLMRPQRNTYGIRPIFDIGCYMQPELFWDIGLVDLTKNIQHRLDQIANLKTHNAMMMINSMFRVDPDSDIPPESLIWRPFGIVPAYEGELDQIPVQDINPHLFAQMEQFYDETIQDIMGMYDYNMGATPQRQERVGTIYSIQSMGEARAKLLLMSMDYLGIRPLLKYLMVLNTFHLPSGFEYRISQQDQHTFGNIFGEDIHPDFDFAARYSSTEPALAKEFRAQQLIQMAQLWMQSPWINQHQFTKLLMELLDVRERDQLMKTPEQIQQEMQQQAQSQMMAEQMKQRYETEGKLITSQQDFKEELALNEQEFQHDMALEAIKQNEKSAE